MRAQEMSKSKVSKFFKSLLPGPASPGVYDVGLDEHDDPFEYVDDDHRNVDVGDAIGIIRAEQVRTPS